MEDIDPDRSRPEYARMIMEDLRWLGLDWDEGPDKGGPCGPYEQSLRLPLYQAALDRLEQHGHLYPCYCTRKELRLLAGAPHVDDAGAPYPGVCRHLAPADRVALEVQGRRPAWRLRCPDASDAAGCMAFTDLVYGRQEYSLAQCGGDFALRRSDGVVAYQLAVVVDDAAMGITEVVRGSDILVSTPRQLWLQHVLGYPHPVHAHVPLLLDEEGERLAKRHQSLALRALRARGVSAEAVVGLLARLAGCQETSTPCRAQELTAHFCWEQVPHESVRIFSQDLAVL